MIYCDFCGKQIPDNVVACPYCGVLNKKGDELAKLVAAARRGSQDAFIALYEKTRKKVYFTIKFIIQDESAIEDIMQSTYLKALESLGRFQGDTKFLPWIKIIAHNEAVSWLKKEGHIRTLTAKLIPDDGQDFPGEELLEKERSEKLPDHVIDQKETTRLLREIIDELPEDQRAVIGMFYYEEMSVKEIAAAMDASESAVKSRLMYGRRKIEKKVLELEKQGTKLYSLSPISFLRLLYHSQEACVVKLPELSLSLDRNLDKNLNRNY